MLNSMGDVDKENFRAGSNGAVVSGVLREGDMTSVYDYWTATKIVFLRNLYSSIISNYMYTNNYSTVSSKKISPPSLSDL